MITVMPKIIIIKPKKTKDKGNISKETREKDIIYTYAKIQTISDLTKNNVGKKAMKQDLKELKKKMST